MDLGLTVNFYNNSQDAGSVVLFQRDPTNTNFTSLAWRAKYNYPQTRVRFTWTVGLSFVWSDTGELVPGVIASASQVVPADVLSKNRITLTFDRGFKFIDTGSGAPQNTLAIAQDVTIPPGMASVGIGMSDQPTFLVPALPNTTVVFTPRPEYWIAFGPSYEPNQVLDINAIENAAKIVFPGNIFAMDATLGPDAHWTIRPTRIAAEV